MISNDDLFERARVASERAYSPYSGVRVGAVVETSRGTLFTGCNVENASYGLTLCAERVALFSMVAAGERVVTRVAVCVCGPGDQTLTPVPCGACLQCLAEFGSDELLVITAPDTARPLSAHLPFPFRLSSD